MQSLSHVVTLNNEGISFLLQQRHREAIHRFISALSMVKQLLAFPQNRVTDDDLPQFIHESTYVIPGLQDTSCFIFANAITLSPQAISDCPISESIANEIASVILLNVALAYHHAGLTEGVAYIKKAESMYETANQLIAVNERRQGTGLLIKAAATNNLAQIRHGRGDYSHSLEGFKYLGSLFASFGEVLQSSKCEHEVYRGMLMNALLVTPPDLAAAA
ncbi:unnamed protein product [Cylindrotheca closterium]|uniref:Uncharacterized protein n=1 Tax=Cylindrotheca closterium TaxID=2856 RepID=A0AAD2JNY8_9STRA|nr:unnamed protein product [Cylindrotheca closterium]